MVDDVDMSREAWALLEAIQQFTHGGPPPPETNSSRVLDAYIILRHRALIEHSAQRNGWIITAVGQRALRDRAP